MCLYLRQLLCERPAVFMGSQGVADTLLTQRSTQLLAPRSFLHLSVLPPISTALKQRYQVLFSIYRLLEKVTLPSLPNVSR